MVMPVGGFVKRLRRWLRFRRPTFGGLVRACAVLVLVFALMASQAVAYYETPGLNGIASTLAGRKVSIHCLSKREAKQDVVISGWGASGYVNGINDPWTGAWFPDNYATFAPGVCEALRGIAAGNASKYTVDDVVWATIVITHESGHLKGAKWSANEAKTQCWAMKHLASTWNMLGITKDPAMREFLWGWAIAVHRALPAQYLDSPCTL